MESYSRPHKRTWKEDESRYNQYLKKWQNRKLSAISRRDVEQWHLAIGDSNGHVAANRTLVFLGSLYARATGIGYEGMNPARGITRFKEQSRDRFLQPDELPRFFAAVDARLWKELPREARDRVATTA